MTSAVHQKQVEPYRTIFPSFCKAVPSLGVLGPDGLNQPANLLSLSRTSSLSFPSDPCHVQMQWHLSLHASSWADSVHCAGRWLTRKTWNYFCCHRNLFRNMFLRSQKATGDCLQLSEGRQAPHPVLPQSGRINQKVFLHRINFTAHRSCSYHQWARNCQNIYILTW